MLIHPLSGQLRNLGLYNSRQLIGPENVKYLSVADLHPIKGVKYYIEILGYI